MANRLKDLLKTNKEALDKFGKVKSKEDALSIATSYISGYTEDELLNDIQGLQEESAIEGALNADQLESVVGGAFDWGGFVGNLLPVVIGAGGAAWGAYQQGKGK